MKEYKKDMLLVIWKDPRSRRNYVIGTIEKTEQYKFTYSDDVYEAQKKGFQLFKSFDNLNKEYYSDKLFPVFSSRLPDPKRRDISSILKKYSLEKYDEFELLKCGAELPIDTIKFVVPLDEIEVGFEIEIYLEGCRHYLNCKGSKCEEQNEISKQLFLKLDKNNKFDENAVKIVDENNNCIGFVPRYFSKKIATALNENKKLIVDLVNIDKEKCSKCVKVKVKMVE